MSENFYDYIHRDNSLEFINNNDYLNNLDIKKIDEVNSLLNLRGHPMIDLSNLQSLNLNSFIDLIRNLQEHNENLVKNNIEIKQKLLRTDDEIINLKNKFDNNMQEKKLLEDKLQEYKIKINFIESNKKNQVANYEQEKEDLNKLISRVKSKESQYKNEINRLKKEQSVYIDKIKNLQERIDNMNNNSKQGLKNNQNYNTCKIGKLMSN